MYTAHKYLAKRGCYANDGNNDALRYLVVYEQLFTHPSKMLQSWPFRSPKAEGMRKRLLGER